MSELRWTLLILGVVFIAALSWWERRRPRQAFAPHLRDAGSSHGDAQRSASADRTVAGEPWIGEAGLSDVVSSDVALTDAADADEPADEHGMHADAEPPGLSEARPNEAGSRTGKRPFEELPTLVIPEDERLALRAAWDEQAPEPTLIDPEAGAAVETLAPTESIEAMERIDPMEERIEPMEERIEPMEPIESIEPAQDAAALEIAGAEGEPRRGERPDTTSGPGALPPGKANGTAVNEASLTTSTEPIVDWPPEESRRILALRLVAPPPERFPGRTLRLALAAEGFLLGKFSIFHKPDEKNRAVLSAASLTRPGAFDLESMDSQRYGGLSLFAVLPGPKTPQQAFEELLATARNLNERLQGALQDERGGPLTPLRVASIRESLRAEAAAPASAAHEA
jgi:cell division protein ZipA